MTVLYKSEKINEVLNKGAGPHQPVDAELGVIGGVAEVTPVGEELLSCPPLLDLSPSVGSGRHGLEDPLVHPVPDEATLGGQQQGRGDCCYLRREC